MADTMRRQPFEHEIRERVQRGLARAAQWLEGEAGAARASGAPEAADRLLEHSRALLAKAGKNWRFEERRNKGLCGDCGAPALPETDIPESAKVALSEGRQVPAAYGHPNLVGKPLARIKTLAYCAECSNRRNAKAQATRNARKPRCANSGCNNPTDKKPIGGRYRICYWCKLYAEQTRQGEHHG